MQPFWDVLWADSWALAKFIGPMAAFALPASALSVVICTPLFGHAWSRRLVKIAAYGVLGGTLIALALSMLTEYALKVEGLTYGRRAMQDAATWQLVLTAPIAAIAVTFVAMRRMPRADPAKADRRFSLRLLFAGQFIAALLLGWWAYTRRDEISQQRNLLEWQTRDQQAKAVFEPLGWYIETWPGHNEVQLFANPGSKVVTDESLRPIAGYDSVMGVIMSSDQITDRGIGHLRGANRLRRLYIKSPQVTDEGIAQLSQLPRLRYVEIHCSEVSSKCLQSLKELRSLRYLVIESEHVSEQDEAEFRAARPGVDVRILRTQ